MSQIQRQDNLFSAEDWKTIYRSFGQANFTAYDYDTIRSSMISYIQTNYPEDFNDYIQSSEFVAIIDLLAYLGQSLAFRTDLNSRENFFDTAERRESILRLAKLINYKPKRNVPARGLLKITKIRTTEPLTDAEGINLAGTNINWNDPNNPEWYDQWLTIMNSSFQSTNQFGNPAKSGTVSSVTADIYNINSSNDQPVVKNFDETVDGISTSIDVVKADINIGGYFEEKSPDQTDAYNIIYRNDNLGFGSVNTGMFMYFKEGELKYEDYSFTQPIPNRTIDIEQDNINDIDVFVQKVGTTGIPLEKWSSVPSLFGQNTIYNSLALNNRTVYNVLSKNNDQIQLVFSDGNFGDAPTGQFRVYFRQSTGNGQVIRANRITNKEINLRYNNSQGQEYTLTLGLSLNYTVSNSQATESDAEIKTNAPQSFYTQDRMVNGEDYNIFPLTQTSTIQKIKSLNKTHIGHSRYMDINDPTGTVKSVNVLGEDGIFYKDPDFAIDTEEITGTVVDSSSYTYIIDNILTPLLKKIELRNYYYDPYKTAVETFKGANTFEMENAAVNQVSWQTFPEVGEGAGGYLYLTTPGFSNAVTVFNNPASGNEKLGFIRPGSKIEFVDSYTNPRFIKWATVKSIRNDGIMIDTSNQTDTTGSIQLDIEVPKSYKIRKVLPNIRNTLLGTEKTAIQTLMENGEEFGIGYNYRKSSTGKEEWYTISESNIDITNDFDIQYQAGFGGSSGPDSSWLIRATYLSATSTGTVPKYQFTVRGMNYVFESDKEVRFFYVDDYKNINTQTGKAVQDTITLLDINKDKLVLTDAASREKLNSPIELSVSGSYTEQDGYVDPKKIKVTNHDSDGDGSPDNPLAHDEVLDNTRYVFFASYQDYDGYTYYKANDVVKQTTTAALASQVAGTWYITNDSSSSYNNYFWKSIGDGIVGNLTQLPNVSNGNTYTKNMGVDGNTTYKAYIGRKYTATDKLYFKYKHSAPRNQRIDPSVSNIIELIILQTVYYTNIRNWFTSGGTTATLPLSPTAEEIRNSLPELEKYKTIGDQIVYNSAKFKLLFGTTAEQQHQAVFRVVKIAGSTYTDNQIKTEIVDAINTYFNITNWDFGDTFYYSELAAYIHNQLSSQISSVVIVPKDAEAKFGDLFQIKAGSNELFFSTASVNDVEIVSGLTGANLRSISNSSTGGY